MQAGACVASERVRQSILAHNRTPRERVEGDVSFWTGTPEQIAATIHRYQAVGFNTFIVELAAPTLISVSIVSASYVKPMVAGAAVG